eukprot:c11228_g1_i1.p1 GENE.c11228_g1_i1~~c11228_g1_i1.p1  ORF type:complete len:596 (+),score=88.74 c11228_g1_i1:117-1790(+)
MASHVTSHSRQHQRRWSRPPSSRPQSGSRVRLHPYNSLLQQSVVPQKKFSIFGACCRKTPIADPKDPIIHISMLPRDILHVIFQSLGTQDKVQCSAVCKDWRDMHKDALVWRNELKCRGVRVSDVWFLLNLENWSNVHELRLVDRWDQSMARLWGWLARCTGLRTIDISDCLVDPVFAEQLPKANLTRLIAEKTRGCDDALMSSILKCTTKLSELYIEDGSITDETVKTLGQYCQQLEVLSLQWCRFISDAGICNLISQLPLLCSIDLSGCCANISDSSIIHLALTLTNRLRFLDVSWCAGVTDKGTTILAYNCPNLRVLRLGMCRRVSDRGVIPIAKNCILLEEISLAGCRHVGDKSLTLLARECHRLHTLDLVWCGGLTNHGLCHLARRWSSRRLENIGLSGCRGVGDSALASIGNFCPALLSLELDGCESVSDIGVSSLAKSCSLIRHLNLSRCVQLTDAATKAIAQSCVHISVLKLSGCAKITDVGVSALGSRCPALRELHLTGCALVSVIGLQPFCSSKREKLDELDIRGCSKISNDDIRVVAKFVRVKLLF